MVLRIYNLISDAAMSEEFSDWLRTRWLEQKFLYIDEGADLFYNDVRKNHINETNKVLLEANKAKYNEELKEVRDAMKIPNTRPVSFISLGSGNSEREHDLITDIQNHYDLTYYGIDSSRDMLQMWIETMQDVSWCQKNFLCADFSSTDFKRELNNMTHFNEYRIFAFIGNTFGNITQTNIIDILYNLLNPGEMIWLEVCLRQWLHAKDDMETSADRYEKMKVFEKSLFYPLKKIGVPYDNGFLTMTCQKEVGLNALQCIYSFKFTQKTVIESKWETITILPDEKVSLLKIYLYDPDGLIYFFQEHWFDFVYKKLNPTRWHFVFQKK